MTTREQIRSWLHEGKAQGATHVIIVCDTFDYEDYPVYVRPGQDIRTRMAEFDDRNMQRVMEVYSLRRDIEEQLRKVGHVFNLD